MTTTIYDLAARQLLEDLSAATTEADCWEIQARARALLAEPRDPDPLTVRVEVDHYTALKHKADDAERARVEASEALGRENEWRDRARACARERDEAREERDENERRLLVAKERRERAEADVEAHLQAACASQEDALEAEAWQENAERDLDRARPILAAAREFDEACEHPKGRGITLAAEKLCAAIRAYDARHPERETAHSASPFASERADEFGDEWASRTCPGCGEPVDLIGKTCGALECGGKTIP